MSVIHQIEYVDQPGSPLFSIDGNTVYENLTINEVEYRLFLNKRHEWCIRVSDPENGEWLAPMHKFPTTMMTKCYALFTDIVTKARRTA